MFDISFALEDELKYGRRTSVDKADSYFYKTMNPRQVINNGRLYIPLK